MHRYLSALVFLHLPLTQQTFFVVEHGFSEFVLCFSVAGLDAPVVLIVSVELLRLLFCYKEIHPLNFHILNLFSCRSPMSGSFIYMFAIIMPAYKRQKHGECTECGNQ